jgi:hypothetical protein
MILNVTKDLAPAQLTARAKIDREAEQVRSGYRTPGTAMAEIYAKQADEGRRFLKSKSRKASNYPWLESQAILLRADPVELATTWVAKDEDYQQVSALINALRLDAKAAVDRATSPKEIDDAATVDWWAMMAKDPKRSSGGAGG